MITVKIENQWIAGKLQLDSLSCKIIIPINNDEDMVFWNNWIRPFKLRTIEYRQSGYAGKLVGCCGRIDDDKDFITIYCEYVNGILNAS